MIEWHDMASAPQDGSWVRLKCLATGTPYVSGHLWRWSVEGWRNAEHLLSSYGAEAIGWCGE